MKVLENFQLAGSFYGDGTRFVRPRPFFYRYCHHAWRLFFGPHMSNPGPAARADLEAARRVYTSLDPDQQEFLLFLYRFDNGWMNPKDCARVFAVKVRSTLTGVMHGFNDANRRLALERGLIDPTDTDESEDGP